MIFDGIIVGIPKQSYRICSDGSVSGQISFRVELETGEEHRLFVAGKIGKYLARIGQGSVVTYDIDNQSKISKKRIRIFKPFVRNASFIEEAA